MCVTADEYVWLWCMRKPVQRWNSMPRKIVLDWSRRTTCTRTVPDRALNLVGQLHIRDTTAPWTLPHITAVGFSEEVTRIGLWRPHSSMLLATVS